MCRIGENQTAYQTGGVRQPESDSESIRDPRDGEVRIEIGSMDIQSGPATLSSAMDGGGVFDGNRSPLEIDSSQSVEAVDLDSDPLSAMEEGRGSGIGNNSGNPEEVEPGHEAADPVEVGGSDQPEGSGSVAFEVTQHVNPVEGPDGVEQVFEFQNVDQREGPGGCCSCWDRPVQAMKAGLVQATTTALTFGTKPLIEAAVMSAFGVTSVAAAPLTASLTASLVGGVYVGAIHTVVSKAVAGLMNSALSVNSYDVRPDSQALLGEIGTIDVPVTVAFTGAYALRGVVMEGQSSVWLHALSKTISSTSGGFVQGLVTDVLRQTMASYQVVYSEKPSTIPEGEKLAFLQETFDKTLNVSIMSRKDIGHDLVGKIVGSVFGMGYAHLVGGTDLTPAAKGAAGMLAYLGSWFTGIHTASAILESGAENMV